MCGGRGFPRWSGLWSGDGGWGVVEMVVMAAGAGAAAGAKAGDVAWCEWVYYIS